RGYTTRTGCSWRSSSGSSSSRGGIQDPPIPPRATSSRSAPRTEIPAPTKNARLAAGFDEVAALTEPDSIHWCDGSAEEYDALAQHLVDAGTFTQLSDAKR